MGSITILQFQNLGGSMNLKYCFWKCLSIGLCYCLELGMSGVSASEYEEIWKSKCILRILSTSFLGKQSRFQEYNVLSQTMFFSLTLMMPINYDNVFSTRRLTSKHKSWNKADWTLMFNTCIELCFYLRPFCLLFLCCLDYNFLSLI